MEWCGEWVRKDGTIYGCIMRVVEKEEEEEGDGVVPCAGKIPTPEEESTDCWRPLRTSWLAYNRMWLVGGYDVVVSGVDHDVKLEKEWRGVGLNIRFQTCAPESELPLGR